MKKFLYIFSLLLLCSCQEHDLISPSPLAEDGGFVAYKADQVKHGSRTVGPNSYFPAGTYYYLWSYKPLESDTTKADFTDKIFIDDHKYNRDLPPLGKESKSNYVELASDNKKKLNGDMHIFGFCINGTKDYPYGLSDLEALTAANNNNTQATKSIFTIGKSHETEKSWDYLDYCRGHVHYDPAMEVYATASSFSIPFTHVLSQVRISVVQEGQMEYEEREDENHNIVYVATGDRIDYDIKLKSMKLTYEYTGVTYDAINNSYSGYTGLPESEQEGKKIGRMLWQSNENDNTGRHIPDLSDNDESTNIQATTLVIPQGVKPSTMPDPNNPNSSIQYKEDFESDDTDNTLWLELVITGKDAWKFDNEHQESLPGENTQVTVWIPLVLNRTGDTSNDKKPDPLRFLPNHAYNLVVSFHGDNIQVVTLKAQIYPWFDGETEDGDMGDMYQTTDIGSPMVFGNVQWNDRYMGSDWVAPTTVEEFIKATGFYYQKDRSIPFYPSEYEGGYVYDLEGKLHDITWAKANIGTATITTLEEDWLASKYTGDYDNFPDKNHKTNRINVYKDDAKVMLRAGGHWTDPSTSDMLNYPMVFPIVSYYMNDKEITAGRDKSVENYYNYADDYHNYSNFVAANASDGIEGVYCTTVDDYYDKATGKIRYYTDPQTGNKTHIIMRYVSEMQNTPAYTWTNPEKHPCPPGWRLPTRQELFSIFPSSPLAGNITFLRHFKVNDGSIGDNDGDPVGYDGQAKDPGYLRTGGDNAPMALDFYLRIPYNDDPNNIYPRLDSGGYGNTAEQMPDDANNKAVNFPAYDPEPGDVTQYVISKRHFDWDELSDAEKAKIPGNNDTERRNLYESYRYIGNDDDYAIGEEKKQYVYYGKPNNPTDEKYKHEKFIDREWGTIFAIKKQGTPDAYRMRWYVKRIIDTEINDPTKQPDIFMLVVEKYKCSQTDKMEYDLSRMGVDADATHGTFYLDFDWSNPESVLYFPISGLVADYDMARNIPYDKAYKGGPMVYNYGTETIIHTSEYDKYGTNNYAAAYRIKIAGTNSWSLYLYPSMERLAQGGQVRPVRTAR